VVDSGDLVYNLFLPIWRKKTGKTGHVTVLDFLVCAQGCKISVSPFQRQ